ncbi:biotin transport system substrate-specific component [Loktanella sp. PT4BL]|jgi:biotin transport system substrate-specific component|uniref:biotin transporter BioY n=2 Tax=Rhodobacterales TaxID=204455 RepID=UPI000D75E15D|nr:biotin transporter BioY [Loktanella sp. PT4BL]PXW67802.1 biotin transport system substrate-specific component [Loktanella sp. PT4BL]
MALALNDKVLAEAFGPSTGTALRIKQAAMVVLGIAVLAIMAKVKVPMWPVPITMGTFAVLTIGATYGPRLGLATIMGYMIIGALGFDVFAGSTAENAGLTYMMGGTGGYLVGYVVATLALGFAARAGWDRSVLMMGVALLIANALIYLPGVAWLSVLYGNGLAWSVEVGMTPFLIGDALKLGLAALLVPGLWKLIGDARS